MTRKQKDKKVNIIKNLIVIIIVMLFLLPIGTTFATVQEINTSDNVIARDLIMFSSIAYADLEKIKDYSIKVDTNMEDTPKLNCLTEITEEDLTFEEQNMVTDEQLSSIKSNTTLLGIPLSDEEENTYDYLFYGLATTEEVSDWKIVNYAKFNTTVLKGTAEFTAMTFKQGNNIVIAYRGTDFDDIGDWAQDLLYGIVGYAGQEGVAQDYARIVAKHYLNENPNINIYVTGHSLGGYLAQIGGAELVGDDRLKNNVKEISYFNGMGLKFWSNFGNNLNYEKIKSAKIDEYGLRLLNNENSKLNRVQDSAKISLNNWKKDNGKIIAYHINGDIISSLGTHVGEKVGYDAYNLCINHHNGNQEKTNILASGLFKIIKSFLNTDISPYVEKYRPQELLDFVWITHETDSFFGVLPYDNGIEPANVNIEFEIPTIVKYKKTAEATLKVKTINSFLGDTNIDINCFKTNKNKLKVTSIKLENTIKTENGYEYIYNVTLKGGIILGNSTLTLKPGILEVVPFENTDLQIIKELSNNVLESESIRTKLR